MPGYWESRLRWEWRERMLGGGGGGCWAEDEAAEDVWKVFVLDRPPGEGKKRKGKSEVAVGVNSGELHAGGGEGLGAGANSGRGKRLWRVLANGIPRVRKRSSVV